jgi:hypothetical protein
MCEYVLTACIDIFRGIYSVHYFKQHKVRYEISILCVCVCASVQISNNLPMFIKFGMDVVSMRSILNLVLPCFLKAVILLM